MPKPVQATDGVIKAVLLRVRALKADFDVKFGKLRRRQRKAIDGIMKGIEQKRAEELRRTISGHDAALDERH